MQELISFSSQSFRSDGFSKNPFRFLEPPVASELAFITQVALVENGAPSARERWQRDQLANLLSHARAKSAFWRARISDARKDLDSLASIPVLTRSELRTQCESEGSLVHSPGGAQPMSYATTGSTGQPVKVFVTAENAFYNGCRSLAQYFINDVSLNANRVKIGPHFFDTDRDILVKQSENWAGNLARLFQNGSNKEISFEKNDAALIEELAREKVDYLISSNRFADILMKNGGVELFERLGVRMWVHQSDYRDPEIVSRLKSRGIVCTSNYSSGEVGPIAYECPLVEGSYHIAHSNVIAEIDDQITADYNDVTVGRILITALHSYATPLIRYDIGDFGTLEPSCRCGHKAPALSNIHGRSKSFLLHPDGTFRAFHVRGHELLRVLDFKESRIIQTAADRIHVEIGGRDSLSAEETTRVLDLIRRATEFPFEVDVTAVDAIDWSDNPKRLFFTSRVKHVS